MSLPYLVKINNTDLPKLKSFTVQRNKLWTDAGRNLAGDLKANFLGIYPKLLLEFTYTTKAEISTLIGLLDQPSFNVAWFDELTDLHKTGTYYAGDYEYPVFDKEKELYGTFTVNLIPFNRYS